MLQEYYACSMGTVLHLMDPFQPQPSAVEPRVLPPPIPGRLHPHRGLNLLCNLAFALGAIGTIVTLSGFVPIARIQDSLTTVPGRGLPKSYHAARTEIYQKAKALDERYINVHTGLLGVNAVLSVCLLAGGYLGKRRHPHGLSLLQSTFVLILAAGAAQLFAQVVLGADSMTMLANMAENIKANGFNNTTDPNEIFAALQAVNACATAQFIENLALAIIAVGIMAYCFVGYRYLQQPEIRAEF